MIAQPASSQPAASQPKATHQPPASVSQKCRKNIAETFGYVAKMSQLYCMENRKSVENTVKMLCRPDTELSYVYADGYFFVRKRLGINCIRIKVDSEAVRIDCFFRNQRLDDGILPVTIPTICPMWVLYDSEDRNRAKLKTLIKTLLN